MMKIKHLLILACLTLSLPMAAQKLFTLEDLNFGGTNYHKLQPKNMFLTWWGDQLVETDVEECKLIDVKTGKKKGGIKVHANIHANEGVTCAT